MAKIKKAQLGLNAKTRQMVKSAADWATPERKKAYTDMINKKAKLAEEDRLQKEKYGYKKGGKVKKAQGGKKGAASPVNFSLMKKSKQTKPLAKPMKSGGKCRYGCK